MDTLRWLQYLNPLERPAGTFGTFTTFLECLPCRAFSRWIRWLPFGLRCFSYYHLDCVVLVVSTIGVIDWSHFRNSVFCFTRRVQLRLIYQILQFRDVIVIPQSKIPELHSYLRYTNLIFHCECTIRWCMCFQDLRARSTNHTLVMM